MWKVICHWCCCTVRIRLLLLRHNVYQVPIYEFFCISLSIFMLCLGSPSCNVCIHTPLDRYGECVHADDSNALWLYTSCPWNWRTCRQVSACTLTTLFPLSAKNHWHLQISTTRFIINWKCFFFFFVMAVSLNSCGFLWLGSSREIEEKILTNVYVCWGEYGQCVWCG